MSPEAVVQRQVDAYNARDLQGFVAAYGDQVKVYRLPSLEPFLAGKPAFSEFYATQRFNRPGLNAQIVHRIVLGNRVIDHERITGVRDGPYEVAAVYEVADGLIQTVWFFSVD